MNFDLSDDHQLIQRTVRDFATGEVAPVAEHLDKTKSFPYEIVRKLPEGAEIELVRVEQGRLSITAGPAQFSLQTLPADDFPALSVDDLGQDAVDRTELLHQLRLRPLGQHAPDRSRGARSAPSGGQPL